MIDRLVSPLKEGKTLYACWCGMRDPQLAGLLASQDFDVVVLDGQHGFHDETSVLNSIPPVLAAGKAPLVRVPVDRWDMVQKVLDYGALGVVAPMVNTVDDAKAFAAAAKFPTMGVRSYGPRYAAGLYGVETDAYVKKANGSTLALAQIETREAYENLEGILSVDGIDGILMGPSDFSIFMTGNQTPDAYGPATIKEVEEIARRTRAAGKFAAAFTINAEDANRVKSFGYQLISIAMDSNVVSAGSASVFNGIERD